MYIKYHLKQLFSTGAAHWTHLGSFKKKYWCWGSTSRKQELIGLGAARPPRIVKVLMFSQKKHYLITAAFLDVGRFSSFLSSFEEAKFSLWGCLVIET